MRIRVHGESLAGAERMRQAAAGLALRGHALSWSGPGSEWLGGLGVAESAATTPADVVIGGAAPSPVALAGWHAQAHAMVLALEPAALARWSTLERLAWSSLYAIGLLEETAAEAIRGNPHGLELARLGMWSAEAPPAAPDATHPDVEILERACERALARHRGPALRPALFADRDGTLVIERGYLADVDDLELLPGVAGALRSVREQGIPVVVISNQSGVGRGLFPLSRVYDAMARLRRMLRAEGVELDAIYFCPHRPDAGCACRKPGTLLLERAAEDLQLSLRNSLMVGDKRLDAATGQAAGGGGALVRTGYGRDEETRIGDGEFARAPDRVFDDFPAAAMWFLERVEAEADA